MDGDGGGGLPTHRLHHPSRHHGLRHRGVSGKVKGTVSRDGFALCLVLGLNRGRGQYLNLLAAQMILFLAVNASLLWLKGTVSRDGFGF